MSGARLKPLCELVAYYCDHQQEPGGAAALETLAIYLRNDMADDSPAAAAAADDQPLDSVTPDERGRFASDANGDRFARLKAVCVRMASHADDDPDNCTAFDGYGSAMNEIMDLVADQNTPDEFVLDADFDAARAEDDANAVFGSPLLPGWLTERMMHDTWEFGLITAGGLCLCIHHIDRVWRAADGGVWLDVTFLGDVPDGLDDWPGLKMVAAPTDRTHGSVNAAHIVAALELGTS